MALLCAHFILSQWLWSVTWGVHHVPFNIVMSIILFKVFLGMNIVPSVLLALVSQIVACITLGLVAFVAMWHIGIGGGPETFSYVPQPLHATLFLGLIYALFQILFFISIQKRYKLPIKSIIFATVISNNLAVLISWLLLSLE